MPPATGSAALHVPLPAGWKGFALRGLLALGCAGLLLFFFSPVWGAFRTWQRAPEMSWQVEVRRAASVLSQADQPGAPIADPVHGAIQWRLLFPGLAHLLGLPRSALLALPGLGCVLVLWFVASLLLRRGVGGRESAMALIVLGASSWFFASTGWLGYFDAWVVLGLLITGFSRARWPMLLACVWTPWVDERFVLALPLALACRHFDRSRPGRMPRPGTDWRWDVALPAALAAAFVAVRLGILLERSAGNASPAAYLAWLDFSGTPWLRLVHGLWEGPRVSWLFIVAAVAILARENPRRAGTLAGGVLALVVVLFATAQDFSRSAMFLVPVALLGAVLLLAARNPRLGPALPIAAAAALLLPAHHVMSDRVVPIFGLRQELTNLRQPPPERMSEIHELRALHAAQQGELERAGAEFILAIRLADNPASPHRQRGLLLGRQGHWEEARQDFSAAVAHAPEDPDGWFLRAQAEMALGNAAAAQADLDQALRLGSAEWARRPDVLWLAGKLRPSRP